MTWKAGNTGSKECGPGINYSEQAKMKKKPLGIRPGFLIQIQEGQNGLQTGKKSYVLKSNTYVLSVR
jgi:hypothetical protein